MEIKFTSNYDDFKYYDQNRTVKEHIVKKILASMEKNGVLLEPVKCDPEMRVVDGQNRIEAYRRKDLPVPYFIDPNAVAAQCSVVNSARTPWECNDYVKSHANSGNSNYKIFKDFLETYPELGVYTIRDLITRKCDPYNRKTPQEIKEGELLFPFDKQDEILEELEYLNSFVEIKERIKHGRKDSFYKAIACCYECEYINNERLYKYIRDFATKFGAFNGFEDCLDCVEKIYNYRSREPLFVKTEVLKMLSAQRKGEC